MTGAGVSETAAPGRTPGTTERVVVVGAGVHGCYVAAELRRAGLSPETLTLVDPNPPLATFERRCRACGMRTLRSPFVQHLGADPFDLEAFAEATDRDGEILAHPDVPDRPTVDLFFDHARRVVDDCRLRESWHAARATDIDRLPTGELAVTTTADRLVADRVVLAIGEPGGPDVPEWAADLPEGAPVAGAWCPEARSVDAGASVAVVGGGVSGATLACALAESRGPGAPPVQLYARGGLETARVEAEPRWMNWRHIADQLHDLPSDDAERLRRVREARNDGTVPPAVRDRLENLLDDGRVVIREVAVTGGDLVDAADPSAGVRLQLGDGDATSVDAVRLATGFADPTDAPLLDATADALGLARGPERYPTLADSTLAWLTTDGRPSDVFVTGTVASLSVGPFARNIIGARRAAERILDAPTTRERYDPPAAAAVDD